MRNGPIRIVNALVLAGAVVAASCGSSGGGTTGTGGSASTGGATGTGGSSSTGGATGTGGSAPGGSGGGGNAVTSLSDAKAVNALSSSEADQLCSDSYAYFGSAITMATTCKWKALAYGASSSAPTDATLQSKCSGQETSCTSGGDPWANNAGCNQLPSTCTATVAQYSACIRDEVAAFIQAVDALPECAALTMSQTSAILDAETASPPASCASLMDTCPDLYPPSPFIQ